MRIATTLLLLCALLGCGQKGPLFLPVDQTQIPGLHPHGSQESVVPSAQ